MHRKLNKKKGNLSKIILELSLRQRTSESKFCLFCIFQISFMCVLLCETNLQQMIMKFMMKKCFCHYQLTFFSTVGLKKKATTSPCIVFAKIYSF